MNTLPVVQSQEAISSTATFNFSGLAITSITIDDAIWFIAKDICGILGYANSRKAVEDHVRPWNKKTVTLKDFENKSFNVSTGYTETKNRLRHIPSLTIINEPGLYGLVLRSRKPEAERFERWVTEEVLPSIRKTGKYSVRQEPQPLQLQSEILIPLVAQLERLEEAQLEANARGVTAGRPNLDGLIRPQYALDSAKHQIMVEHIFDEDLLCGAFRKNSQIYDIIIADVRAHMPIRLKNVPSTDLLDRSYCYRLINERKRMLGLTALPRTKPALIGNKYQMPSGVYIH